VIAAGCWADPRSCLTTFCDFRIDKIVALAGVCRTTVQRTLHEARLLGHLTILERPRRVRKNLTNFDADRLTRLAGLDQA
jgi:hypothetical protein